MPCDQPYTVVLNDVYKLPDGSLSKTVAVPCGKCFVCRKNKVDEWSFRLRQEQKVCSSSFFVTLTYDNATLPRSRNNMPTLHPPDLKKFFDRLRVNMKRDSLVEPLRYYLVGEYGDLYERPHYHAIIMNSTVEHIDKAWTAGTVHAGSVTSDSIAYCVKYLDKGRKVPKHERDDRVKEFSRMSRNLGANYLTPQMIKWHRADLNRNYLQNGNFKIALPAYYRNRIFTQSERQLQRVLIFDKVVENEAKAMKLYFREYPHHNQSDFFKLVEYAKAARHSKLHKNGKKRSDL